MNIAMKVEYIARDSRRQDIPWVRVTDKVTGRVTVYQDSDKPLSPEEICALPSRTMDCMDCHNRPSHAYKPPDFAIDLALSTGPIDREPARDQEDRRGGHDHGLPVGAGCDAGHRRSDQRFLPSRTIPTIASQKEKEIKDAILAVQACVRTQHLSGHESRSGPTIPTISVTSSFPAACGATTGSTGAAPARSSPNDCRTCHIILSQGPKMAGQVITAEKGLEFRHPVDIGDAWKQGACYECHTGVQP